MWKQACVASLTLAAITGAATAASMSLTSPDIKPGATMAIEQVFSGCGGKNISPALSWSGAPKGTKSFALTVFDPDAPTGSGFWHWSMFDIPADVMSLAKGAGDPTSDAAPKGAIQIRNDFSMDGYGGPCPPPGPKHHYIFTIFAVDAEKLGPDAKASAAVVGFNLHFHTLGKATLTGVWGH